MSATEATPGDAVRARGGCLCGGVRYEVRGALRDVIACHCSQCRKTSGHFVAASQALDSNLVLLESSTLQWYRSSPEAERGFCSRCGGNLFWRPSGATPGVTSIMAGSLDPPTGLKVMRHIFVADKSDYYDILDPAS
ncbi:MAG TPA: GFA family protein [Reyranella sp.]|nr:GFA family protein [Reyranella sp.]